MRVLAPLETISGPEGNDRDKKMPVQPGLEQDRTPFHLHPHTLVGALLP